jgi:predicted dienelactone hydrolase
MSSLASRVWQALRQALPGGLPEFRHRRPRAERLPPAPAGPTFEVAIVDMALHDRWRRKTIPVRLTFPAQGRYSFPIIVFSHGAYGSSDCYALLAQHWAAHGYVCLQPSHSDALARGEPRPATDNFRDWPNRPLDISFLLDELPLLEDEVSDLAGRLDTALIGVGGHSYGASTAQLLAGVRVRDRPRRKDYRDPRIRAVLLMSPQGSGPLHEPGSWSGVTLPMMTLTGTEDTGQWGGGPDWRQEPFKRAPAGDKYLVVVQGGQHDFGGISRRVARPHDPRQAGIALHASLAFWDAHLKNDAGARQFLKGGGLRDLLGADATFEQK